MTPKSFVEHLDISFAGSLVGVDDYTSQGEEIKRGQLRRMDGDEAQLPGVGVVLGGGRQGVRFEPARWPGEAGALLVEVRFTLEQVAQPGTLVDAGGILRAAFADGRLTYGFAAVEGEAPLREGQHVLSLCLRPATATLEAMLDGDPVPSLSDLAPAPDLANRFVFGNDDDAASGLACTLHAIRVATTDDDAPTDFRLQPDPEPGTVNNQRRAEILAQASAVRPTPEQVAWQELQYTGFLHFGPNTFANVEWGDGTFPAAEVNPTDADVDSWVRHLCDAGMRMAILTVKHHDGFLLYPTRYSDYSIRQSPWRDGKGDILREFTDAAARHGMKVGVYLSPADSNAELAGCYANGSAATPRTIPTLVPDDDRAPAVAAGQLPTFTYDATDYGQYFLNQLYEVLTGYGRIDEVWFDGAPGNTDGTEHFDYAAYYDLIKQLQPHALIAVGGRDIRWIGNELGRARDAEWSVVPVREEGPGGKLSVVSDGPFDQSLGDDDQIVEAIGSGRATWLHWWPGEADMKLTPGWFWGPDKDTPVPAATLLEHWEATVGCNAVLLLNVPPTTEGRLPEAAVAELQEFARLRRRAFGNDLALGRAVRVGEALTHLATDGNNRTAWLSQADDHTPLVVDLGARERVDRISVGEDVLAHGQQICDIRVEAELDGGWREIAAGAAVGVNRIWRLDPSVTAQRLRVTVRSARGPYGIARIALYQTLASD